MRRARAWVPLLAAGCVVAGCGGSGRTIASTTALHDLRSAGLTQLEIARFTKPNRNGEIDTIGLPDIAMAFLPPVQLIDYASDKTAIHFYGRGPTYVYRWYRADVRAGQGLVPSGFVYSPKKAFSARICNVILWSYNLYNDPRLPARLSRAARLLHQSCG